MNFIISSYEGLPKGFLVACWNACSDPCSAEVKSLRQRDASQFEPNSSQLVLDFLKWFLRWFLEMIPEMIPKMILVMISKTIPEMISWNDFWFAVACLVADSQRWLWMIRLGAVAPIVGRRTGSFIRRIWSQTPVQHIIASCAPGSLEKPAEIHATRFHGMLWSSFRLSFRNSLSRCFFPNTCRRIPLCAPITVDPPRSSIACDWRRLPMIGIRCHKALSSYFSSLSGWCWKIHSRASD